jgi:hypothetical protein
MPNYICWTKYGESGIIIEEGEEEQWDNDDIIAEYAGALNDTAMGEAEDDEQKIVAEDEPADDLGQAICDAQSECEKEKEKIKFEHILEDHKKLLYPICDTRQKKLGTILELLQWKTKNGVSDKAFGELLTIQMKMLLKDNK